MLIAASVAGHMVLTLVTGENFRLDTAGVLRCWRASDQDQMVRVCFATFFCQLYGITLAAHVTAGVIRFFNDYHSSAGRFNIAGAVAAYQLD